LLLAACFVSEEPLLNERNASAAAMWSGASEICQFSEDDAAPECDEALVIRAENGSYFIVSDDDERTELRFRKIARGGWIVQAHEAGDDDGYFYLVASRQKKELKLSMMDCDALPEKMRAEMIDAGELVADDSMTINVCMPQSVKALERVGRFYLKGELESEGFMVLRPRP
jgi:hypothetical protein